jgi:SAM-dependent methyltransferase
LATIDTPETTEVDVETLMGLIRRRVQGLPDARYIMGEIEKVRLKAEGIATGRIGEAKPELEVEVDAPSRPKSIGWQREIKGRVATLIMRAVRQNFRLQEVFNNSVVGVLQLMAEDLYAYEKRLDAADQAGSFDQVAFEKEYLNARPFCSRSLALFREMLQEEDLALVPFSGSGELLATFKENGIETIGVDSDPAMVRLCRERGLNALHANILDHVRDTPDASYGGIFAWRVVERLTNDQTAELLKLTKRKLKRGGIFVASATNMDHLPALRSFYLDPSLVRPVPARLLAFMIERSGLRIDRFIFSSDQEELSQQALASEVYPYDEYTLVAVND